MISAATTVYPDGSGAEGGRSTPGECYAGSPQMDRYLSQAAGWSAEPVERAIKFGPFCLLPARRLLLKADQPVRLGSRALEILIALVERAGELVGKDELMARVWPNIFVEEGNLKFQIARLRRVLGDRRGSNRYLATISGRGYRFVAPVTLAKVLSTPAERAHNLPAPIARAIDHADAVAALTAQLSHHRLVTIVGPGGIGKTTVALAVARGLIGAYEHGVGFVDLTSAIDPQLAPSAVAAVLGLEIRSEHPIAGLIDALRNKRMLLVLDNCERVIEAAAVLASELLNGAPGIGLLATSREPLRAAGELIHRLLPLESPPAPAGLTAAEALAFPAVQLFVDRAAASLGGFELSDEDAPLVADICRRLDGSPLAIEFAARRVEAFGVRGLAAHLCQPLRVLTGGCRPAPPRHRSLQATLDWGYDLLREDERVVLRRVAIFAGGFTLEAASAVSAGAGIAAAKVVEFVVNLVAKSFIAAEFRGAVLGYRLLETTRAYALEKLSESGELEVVKGRYAEYLRDLAGVGRDAPLTAERLAACGSRIAHASAARDRVFAPASNGAIGATRTACSLPASFHL